MTASFDMEQPSVNVIQDSDKLYIFIAVNGKWATRQYSENQEAQDVWECDYREIVTTSDKINIDDVKNNPEKYLDWVEPKEKSEAEKILDLQEQNKMLTQCLMEMSEIVYA